MRHLSASFVWKHWTAARRPFGRGLPLSLAAALVWLVAVPPAAAQPVTIPLQVVNIGTPSAPEYKLGIYVGLGGGAPQLYEFDTGAAGLFAAYNATLTPWWTSFDSTGQPINMSYASGIQYNSTIVNTSVSLYGSPTGPALATVTTDVGQIEQASGSKVANWNADLANGTPPLYGAFYGDFGMALNRNEGDSPVPPIPDPDTNPSLYAVVPQLGPVNGLLGNGFIISLGSYANPTPTLQIGLTADDRARFPTVVAMNPPSLPIASGTFPFGGGPTYSLQILQGSLTLNAGHPTEIVQALGAVLDTGAPSTEIHVYGSVTVPETLHNLRLTGVDAHDAHTQTLMHFIVGDEEGLNAVGTTTSANPLFPTQGYINTGLNIFFANDVMFDLEHGVVGFAPVPEPATAGALIAFGGLLAAVLRARRATRGSSGVVDRI